jgi:hypothetical protein
MYTATPSSFLLVTTAGSNSDLAKAFTRTELEKLQLNLKEFLTNQESINQILLLSTKML